MKRSLLCGAASFSFLFACSNPTSPTGMCGDGSCDPGENCSSCPGDCGSCSTTCGPTNCAGCCDGDSCVSGNAPTACGGGGAACTVCAPGFLCTAGSCAVDPASRWDLYLGQLTVNTTTLAGDAWDTLGGAPDPFVEIRVGSETATPAVTGVGSDVFSVSFTGGPTVSDARADAIAAYLAFFVYDEDLTSNDRIGACTAAVSPDTFMGASQTLNCPRDPSFSNAGFSLTWHLEHR